ncbi:MAG: NmrA/HSCARG family protein [Nitrospiraceae bacterium]
MANQPQLILVTGATGRQGGAVAHRLLRQGQKVRVLTRHPEKAGELTNAGAEVVRGDLTDPASLEAALRGMQGVFAMSTPFEAGLDAEVRQGMSMADAAKKAGVAHYVYTSVGSADRNTGIPHFDTKWKVEQHIRRIGLPATILRPVFFMENFSTFFRPSDTGVIAAPLPTNRRLQMIAVRDIGEFGAAAFMRPEDFLGQAIDLAGDERTIPEAAAVLSDAMGRPIRHEPMPDDKVEEVLGHDVALMFRWLRDVGYAVDIAALRQRYGIPLTSFAQLVATADWVR